MPDYYKKVSSVKKTFPKPVPTEQYETEIGPERPTAVQRFTSDHPVVGKAVGAAKAGGAWMQKRGQEIQREAPRSMPRSPMAGLPQDPFGMSRAGNPFGGGSMSGPFMDSTGPIRREGPPRRVSKGSRTIYHPNGDVEVVHATTSSRKRKSRRERDGDGGFGNPMHIPKSMRHLF